MEILLATNNTNANFKGNIYIKNRRDIPEKILKALDSAKFLKDLSYRKDVVVRLKDKATDARDPRYTENRRLYNIAVSLLEEDSFLDKCLDALHLKTRKNLAHNYHSEKGIISRISNPEYANKLMSKFDIII